MPRIEIRIPRRGSVSLEGFEFQGTLCRETVDPFLRRMAGKVETDVLKPEYRSVNEIQAGLGAETGKEQS